MSPQRLSIAAADRAFLIDVAHRILGEGEVAATTAARLEGLGIDVRRVNALIPLAAEPVALDGVVVKKIAADQETPENFGLFIRRRPKPAAPSDDGSSRR